MNDFSPGLYEIIVSAQTTTSSSLKERNCDRWVWWVSGGARFLSVTPEVHTEVSCHLAGQPVL